MRTRLLIRRARENRRTLTKEERILWYHLRYDQLGVRFRRQHPIGPYIVVFACISHRLVVEADGGQHADSLYDRTRDRYLMQNGWTVLESRNPRQPRGSPGIHRRHPRTSQRSDVPQRIAGELARVPLRSGGTARTQ